MLTSLLVPGYRLRMKTVSGDRPIASIGRRERLDDHFAMLADEFAGTSELELDLACTITRIRRRVKLRRSLLRFRAHWSFHGPFLVRRLTSRWLISCADTIVDHPLGRAEQAIALTATTLGNTVKLYETERHLLGIRMPEDAAHPRVTDAAAGPEPLFDGMTTYLAGRGDMLANLHSRMELVTRGRGAASMILRELWQRMHSHDSAFRRLGSG